MIVERTGPRALRVELAGEEELRAEERTNLRVGGLLLRTNETMPAMAPVTVTLALAGRGSIELRATVVATPPGALALQIEGNPQTIVATLLADLPAPAPAPPAGDGATPGAAADEPTAEASGTAWDRLRALTPPQRVILAPKADRQTRALLLQDSDPLVLFSLLKNPRLGIDEVVRIAKSSYLSYQAAELILKTTPWAANLDVRLALIHNPKLGLPLALRILPTLPDAEVRTIAKGTATSQQLRQAALRKISGG